MARRPDAAGIPYGRCIGDAGGCGYTADIDGDPGCRKTDQRCGDIPCIYGRKPEGSGNFALIIFANARVFVQNVKLEKKSKKTLDKLLDLCYYIQVAARERGRGEKKVPKGA